MPNPVMREGGGGSIKPAAQQKRLEMMAHNEKNGRGSGMLYFRGGEGRTLRTQGGGWAAAG
jgi:hypothetical protein